SSIDSASGKNLLPVHTTARDMLIPSLPSSFIWLALSTDVQPKCASVDKIASILFPNITRHAQILRSSTDHTIDIGDYRNHLEALKQTFGSGNTIATHNTSSNMMSFGALLDTF